MIATVIVSDRGDLYLPDLLHELAPYHREVTRVIRDDDHELGMAGAVRKAWAWALEVNADYLLHLEEDFRFNEPTHLMPTLSAMQYILERNPHLAQVVLKRQAWNDEEKAAGGIVEANPSAYQDFDGMRHSARWCEHDVIFSLNPCLIPRRVLELGWPDGNEAEFTQRCRDAGLRFAFYGHRFEPPLVTHVGEVRAAGWRL